MRRSQTIEIHDGIKWLQCLSCNELVPEFNMSKHHTNNNGDKYQCKKCYNKYMRDYSKNRKNGSMKSKRIEIFNRLGGMVCKDCGCNVYEYLELHHKNGGGNKERKKCGCYRDMINYIYKLPDDILIKEYEVRCELCHDKHHLEKLYGIYGFKIYWCPDNLNGKVRDC